MILQLPDVTETPRTTKALAQVIDQINRLDQAAQDIIALLPELSYERLIATRNNAKLLEACAWKVEIACDAEIWERHEKAINGRGNVDVEEKGIMAAVNKRAQEIGCSASNVRANARLYKRFKKVLSTYHILEEKSFFQAAEASDDPEAAIAYFAEQRGANPFFRPADAWRWVKEKNAAKSQDQTGPDDTVVLQDEQVREWLLNYKAAIENQEKSIPPQAGFLRDMARAHARHAAEQLQRTVYGDCSEIMRGIEEAGGLSDEDIDTWLYEHCYFISERDLGNRIAYMEADKWIVEDDAGQDGKQVTRRGKLPTFYVPYYVKRKRGAQATNDEDEDEEG